MADKQIKVAVVVDPSGAKTGVKSVESELNKLGNAGEKTASTFASTFGKGGAASKGLGSLGVDVGGVGNALGGVTVPVLAAGAALAGFAVNSAKKFADLGLQVEKFSTVAGTTTEDASRWIAVADDFGVGADAMSDHVGKLGKTLGANLSALDKYGVAVVTAKDGTTDLSATTLNVIDAYNATTDPAKKAALGAAAFGKGYQELIPLITQGSAAIKASFDSVDKAQVFDDKKVAMAKNYGVQIDNLKDKFYDIQLVAGQKLIPVLIGVADGLAKIAGPASSAVGAAFDGLVNGIQTVAYVLTVGLLGDFRKYNEELPTVTANVDDATASMLLHARYVREAADGYGPLAVTTALATTAQEAHTKAVEAYKGPSDDLTASGYDYAEAVTIATEATANWKKQTDAALTAVQVGLDQTKYKWDVMTGAVTADETWLHLQQSFDDVKKAGVEAFDAAAKGAADAEEKGRAYQLTTDAMTKAVIGYGKEVLALPPEKVTTLLAEIKAGELERVEQQLEILTRNRNINIDIIAKGGAGYDTGVHKAAGGPVSAMSTYRVNENGEEYFTPTSNGTITPAGKWGGGGGAVTYVTHNYNIEFKVPPGADYERHIVEALTRFERTNGASWRAA